MLPSASLRRGREGGREGGWRAGEGELRCPVFGIFFFFILDCELCGASSDFTRWVLALHLFFSKRLPNCDVHDQPLLDALFVISISLLLCPEGCRTVL